jgi:putative transposase
VDRITRMSPPRRGGGNRTSETGAVVCPKILPPLRGGYVMRVLFHGLRFACEYTGCASPVATGLRPFGAGKERHMPGTYSQILLHIVFSTKHRQPWIAADIAERLHAHMGGIVRAEKGVLYDIGGIEDHVHVYLRWRPDGSVSDLMRTVKARSSKWVHETFPLLSEFAWQEGYSVFTVSKSQEEAVKRYIAGQAEHHKTRDFKAELLALLRGHGIEFDERYVFE